MKIFKFNKNIFDLFDNYSINNINSSNNNNHFNPLKVVPSSIKFSFFSPHYI